MAATEDRGHDPAGETETRRDFLLFATGAMKATGTALAVWPFIENMEPAQDTLAASTAEVDLEPIAVGQRITVKWRGQPVFIAHRSHKEIAEAVADDHNPNLVDPATDAQRVQRKPWLIVIGVCTHLGCIPKGQRPTDPRGKWHGWYCPCHGSQYDTAGRIRAGPAPKNLYLPPLHFLTGTHVKLG